MSPAKVASCFGSDSGSTAGSRFFRTGDLGLRDPFSVLHERNAVCAECRCSATRTFYPQLVFPPPTILRVSQKPLHSFRLDLSGVFTKKLPKLWRRLWSPKRWPGRILTPALIAAGRRQSVMNARRPASPRPQNRLEALSRSSPHRDIAGTNRGDRDPITTLRTRGHRASHTAKQFMPALQASR
jgi:hypothetical protein